MSGPRRFRVRMSERCFRFKPDALPSHAPKVPGVYEFVTFDPQAKAEVLYVGCAVPGAEFPTIFDALAAHMMGNLRPSSEELFKAAKDVYFDYVLETDASAPEDLLDIAAAFAVRHKPRLNPPGGLSGSGRGPAEVEEVE